MYRSITSSQASLSYREVLKYPNRSYICHIRRTTCTQCRENNSQVTLSMLANSVAIKSSSNADQSQVVVRRVERSDSSVYVRLEQHRVCSGPLQASGVEVSTAWESCFNRN
ncbi:hypothetical protein J6590_055721 [Homalodisca vitripennis]|nr:hypothetical protein J6590_055721 [Homalodisca vitripennis]